MIGKLLGIDQLVSHMKQTKQMVRHIEENMVVQAQNLVNHDDNVQFLLEENLRLLKENKSLINEINKYKKREAHLIAEKLSYYKKEANTTLKEEKNTKQNIMVALKNTTSASATEIQQLLGISKSHADESLKDLEEKGALVKKRYKNKSIYTLASESEKKMKKKK